MQRSVSFSVLPIKAEAPLIRPLLRETISQHPETIQVMTLEETAEINQAVREGGGSLTGRHGAAMDTEDCHGALAFIYCPPGLDSPLCRKVRSFYAAPVSLWSLSVLFSHSGSLISQSWILTSSFTPVSHPKE
ncbi:hypothetical protein QQF64_010430 [Cirrhinus molitorella]|uniref:Uncharacterized protein n=1 Tax=Cirrhinus molitorella TaxID=172907 RepID=A0ABR3M418_9TELE